MSQRETPWCPHQRRGPGGVLSPLPPGLQKDPLRRFVAWAVEALQKPGDPPWAQIPPVLLGEAESGCLHREDLGLKHRREGCPFLGRGGAGVRGSGGGDFRFGVCMQMPISQAQVQVSSSGEGQGDCSGGTGDRVGQQVWTGTGPGHCGAMEHPNGSRWWREMDEGVPVGRLCLGGDA